MLFTLGDPDGDTLMLPCVHLVQAHPGGDTIRLPKPGGSLTVPCRHISLQHPGGDPGPIVPCVHPVPEVSRDNARNLIFYTGDSFVQSETIKAVDRLAAQNVVMASPLRPLRIYNRFPLLPNHPADGSNPFWSQYDPIIHAIQIHYDPTNQTDYFLDTLHHELGHATLGHTCVQLLSTPGNHYIDTVSNPLIAMSEGWAHFVALAIRFTQGQDPVDYFGKRWEKREPAVPLDPNIESNVARTLWDLFDQSTDEIRVRPPRLQFPGPDAVALPFSELFRVYSPGLAVLLLGPLIPSLDVYLTHLIANNPTQASAIMAVRKMNCG